MGTTHLNQLGALFTEIRCVVPHRTRPALHVRRLGKRHWPIPNRTSAVQPRRIAVDEPVPDDYGGGLIDPRRSVRRAYQSGITRHMATRQYLFPRTPFRDNDPPNRPVKARFPSG
jgi:hypothetical protein